MLKRWAALPPIFRWLMGIVAVVLAVAVVWVLLVPAPDWLAHHDVGSVKGSLHETALDNARGRLLTLGAGLFAAGALAFTARNFTLSREGQVADRYTKAIEQLGAEKVAVRIGGIYALERIARDSARDHPTVMDVLSAFIREHSIEPWPPSAEDESEAESGDRRPRPDVQAAATVIARRDPKRDIRPINLSGAELSGAELSGANLADANLAGAGFHKTDLAGADLQRANLLLAEFDEANLAGANLADTILGPTGFFRTNLTRADLTGRPEGAVFAEASLSGARWPRDSAVPEGWRLDADSDRLERSDTDAGLVQADRP